MNRVYDVILDDHFVSSACLCLPCSEEMQEKLGDRYHLVGCDFIDASCVECMKKEIGKDMDERLMQKLALNFRCWKDWYKKNPFMLEEHWWGGQLLICQMGPATKAQSGMNVIANFRLAIRESDGCIRRYGGSLEKANLGTRVKSWSPDYCELMSFDELDFAVYYEHVIPDCIKDALWTLLDEGNDYPLLKPFWKEEIHGRYKANSVVSL